MFRIIDTPVAINYTLAYFGPLENTIPGSEILQLPTARALAETQPLAGRALRAKSDGEIGGSDEALTGLEAGWFMSLQALVMLFSFLRLLYFFRVNLKFGALVHTVIEVLFDIVPMVVLLLVITLGFAFALLVLLQCELGIGSNPDWHDAARAIFIVINMGMYTYTDPLAQELERTWVIAHRTGSLACTAI